MGKMGGRRHLKALAAPRSWRTRRKGRTFVAKPTSGPHPLSLSVPAYVLVRDILGETATSKEAKAIIKQGKMLVDGKVMKQEKRPVGFMDVVSFPTIGKHYRITIEDRGRIAVIEIPEKESKLKVTRVQTKFNTKGGDLAVGVHDGSSLRVPGEVPVDRGDSVVISLPGRKLLDVVKMKEGAMCFTFRGSAAGKLGKLRSSWPSDLRRRALVELGLEDGSSISTLKDYVMVIGAEAPKVTVR